MTAATCVPPLVWLRIATFTGTRVPSDASSVACRRGVSVSLPASAAAILGRIVVGEVRQQAGTDDRVEAGPEHVGKALVAVQDDIVRCDRDGALAHGLDHHTVGLIRAFQREDAQSRPASRR